MTDGLQSITMSAPTRTPVRPGAIRMKCPKCQFENPAGAKFCNECGGRLDVACRACGKTNPSGSKFCNDCGHSLTEAKSIDYTRPHSYIPRFLADKILTARGAIEGERKLVTVFFADVANYTSISEKLDPEEVHQIMDGCFKLLMDEIHRYEGTIDKFTGDGVMALFGAPVSHEDHAQRACYAALAIQRAMQGYGNRVQQEYGVEFKMRVGLDSGQVIVGSVGNDLKMDYTAIGDPVNLASRMESMTEPGSILVSGDTQRTARDYFRFKALGSVSVKGKEEAVEAHVLLEPTGIETRIGASVARGLTKFVGRQREIGALKETFEKARSGSGQVVGVVGEAGVGKSRLLIEFREELPSGDHTYLEGRCLHYGGSMAYLPLLDILRAYFDIREGDRERAVKNKMAEKVSTFDEQFKAILPPLHDILSLKVDDEEYAKLDPPLKRVKAFEALRDLLIRESQERPLVLAVEDLHWIDSTTEEFLGYLMGSLATTRILLILLYRPEYTHQWGSKSFYTGLNVDQLSGKTSAELVQAILEGGEAVPELRELIIGRTGGNPFFVEEFTHSLLENGSIRKEDHQYVLSARASDIHVPDTIQGVIAARMDRLEQELKRTMQVASVIGRDFAYRILHTITGTGEELKSHLVNLQGLEFIYEKSLFPELEYIFKHALTQEVAYESLLLKRRKEIHERIGQAIEELYPDRLEEFSEVLAHHYSRSENSEKAYRYLELSGNKATRNYAKWEALRYYREAIDILSRWPETEANKRKGIEIRLLMTTPMRYLAHPEGSLQVIEEGVKLAKEVGDDRSVAHFYSLISHYYSVKGETFRGIEYAEHSFTEAEKVQDLDLMAPIGFQLCGTYIGAGENLRIAGVAPKVIGLLEETQRESEPFGWGFNMYAALCSVYGLAVAYLGDFEKGEALCEKGLRYALEMDDLYAIGFVDVMYGALCMLKGDGEKAVELSHNAIKYLEETQFLTIMGVAWLILGYGHYLLGQPEAALEYFEKGLEIQRSVGFSQSPTYVYRSLAEVHLHLGNLGEARSFAEEALKVALKNNESTNEAGARVSLGGVLGKTDPSRSGEAEAQILRGIEMSDELQTKPLSAQGHLILGELYADTGQGEKALDALKKAEAEFKDMGMDYWLRKAQEVLARVEGKT